MVFETALTISAVLAGSAAAFSRPTKRKPDRSVTLEWLSDVEDLVAEAKDDDRRLQELEVALSTANKQIDTRSRQIVEFYDELESAQRLQDFLESASMTGSPVEQLRHALLEVTTRFEVPTHLLAPLQESLIGVEVFVQDLEACLKRAQRARSSSEAQLLSVSKECVALQRDLEARAQEVQEMAEHFATNFDVGDWSEHRDLNDHVLLLARELSTGQEPPAVPKSLRDPLQLVLPERGEDQEKVSLECHDMSTPTRAGSCLESVDDFLMEELRFDRSSCS